MKYWFLEAKAKSWTEVKNQSVELPQPRYCILWGHHLLYKAWEEDATCEDCVRLKKSAQSLFPCCSTITCSISECSLMYSSFPFQCSLVTDPDFALLTMKVTVIATFFGKYSWCVAISLWVCALLSCLTSGSWLLLFPLEPMADECLSSGWSKPWHSFSETGYPNFLTLA